MLDTVVGLPCVFLGWRAVHPIEAPVPSDTLAALDRIANQQQLGNQIIPDFMCAPTLDLSVVSFFVSPDQLTEASNNTESQELPLPYVAEEIIAAVTKASLDLSSLSHLQAQDAVIYLDKHNVPFLEVIEESNEEIGEEEEKKSTNLSTGQVSTLGWHLYSELPPPSSTPGNLRVLVLVTPPNIHPLVVETTSSTYSKTSYKVSENVLLVMVPSNGALEDGGQGDNYSEVAAQEILNWLSAYTLQDIVDSDSTGIAQQCMQKAASEISKFLKILNIVPKTGIKITSGVAHAAATAAKAYTLAEESLVGSKSENKEGCLDQSRVAWEAARALAIHTDLGATPQLPSEHVLALLLPIGLPIILAIVKAVGRELKDAKKLLLLRKKEDTKKDKES
ncbi:hypothetical protein NADE_007815 [Nannochloris sp. 'desiccata']|nr:hypothetical protein NADE_007815 [Chlorella desiccata (nom. nud.)]